MDEITTKICLRCGEEKPLDKYYRQAKGRFGRKSICIDCFIATMNEMRERKRKNKPKPEVKRGRPAVSEKRSLAAKRAHENKRQRPNLTSRNIRDIILRLEEDGQPWMLMKYPFNVRGFNDMGGTCYEVIIWQTIESEQGYATMECDPKEAIYIIEQFGLHERKRYKEENCTIYAKNDHLQEMHLKLVRQREAFNKKAKAARELYHALEVNSCLFTPEEYAALRDKAADAEQDFIIQRNKYVAEFPKKNGIIIYNL